MEEGARRHGRGRSGGIGAVWAEERWGRGEEEEVVVRSYVERDEEGGRGASAGAGAAGGGGGDGGRSNAGEVEFMGERERERGATPT